MKTHLKSIHEQRTTDETCGKPGSQRCRKSADHPRPDPHLRRPQGARCQCPFRISSEPAARIEVAAVGTAAEAGLRVRHSSQRRGVARPCDRRVKPRTLVISLLLVVLTTTVLSLSGLTLSAVLGSRLLVGPTKPTAGAALLRGLGAPLLAHSAGRRTTRRNELRRLLVERVDLRTAQARSTSRLGVSSWMCECRTYPDRTWRRGSRVDVEVLLVCYRSETRRSGVGKISHHSPPRPHVPRRRTYTDRSTAASSRLEVDGSPGEVRESSL